MKAASSSSVKKTSNNNNNKSSRPEAYEKERVTPLPLDTPLSQIRNAIPKKYFQRSTAKSFAYLFRDFLQIGAAFAIMHYFIVPALDDLGEGPGVAVLRFFFWALYVFAQATNFTAVWVLGGHEGGHGAFSPSHTINEIVGFACHSMLLVPYHSWRVTHAHHHKYTNHLTMDTAFLPDLKEEPLSEAIYESPIVTFTLFLLTIVVGWPAYFTLNVWGRKAPEKGLFGMTHFLPSSGYFQENDRAKVLLSDLLLGVMCTALGASVYQFGWWPVFAYYFMPYLGCNAWLVFITFMHHHDVRMPHFSADQYTFVRGATSAIDRDYGWLLNPWLHHITDSHIVHHLFHEMPFYNAIEVTRHHIRDILGKAYLEDHRWLWTQAIESWCQCRYIIPSEGIAYFRK